MRPGTASARTTATRSSKTETLPLEASPVRRNRIPNGPILMVSSEALTLIVRCCIIVPFELTYSTFLPFSRGDSETRLCPVCLNAKSSEERVVYKRLNSTETLIQRTPRRLISGHYVLHRAGCSQEDDQLLHQGCERSGSLGRPDRSKATRTRGLGEGSSATLVGGRGR